MKEQKTAETVELSEVVALKYKLIFQELTNLKLVYDNKQRDLAEISKQIVTEYSEEGKYVVTGIDFDAMKVTRRLADEQEG